MTSSTPDRGHLSIREVLELLVEEFPGVTISKIRFLESRGLIQPERSPAGYRRFYQSDVDRLRWILRQQRGRYRLNEIKGLLDQEPPAELPLFELEGLGDPFVPASESHLHSRSGAAGSVGSRDAAASRFPDWRPSTLGEPSPEIAAPCSGTVVAAVGPVLRAAATNGGLHAVALVSGGTQVASGDRTVVGAAVADRPMGSSRRPGRGSGSSAGGGGRGRPERSPAERGANPERGPNPERGADPERGVNPERGANPERGPSSERGADPARRADQEFGADQERGADPELGVNAERNLNPGRGVNPERGPDLEHGGVNPERGAEREHGVNPERSAHLQRGVEREKGVNPERGAHSQRGGESDANPVPEHRPAPEDAPGAGRGTGPERADPGRAGAGAGARDHAASSPGAPARPAAPVAAATVPSPRSVPSAGGTAAGTGAAEAAGLAAAVDPGPGSLPKDHAGATALSAAAATRPGGVRPDPAAPAEAHRPARASGNGEPQRGIHRVVTGASFSTEELAVAAGVEVALVEELVEYGLISGRDVAGVRVYDEDALLVTRAAGGFRRFGIEGRHLKSLKHAAEREAGLYSQVVTPLLRQRNPESHARAVADLAEMCELGASLRSYFVAAELRRLTGG